MVAERQPAWRPDARSEHYCKLALPHTRRLAPPPLSPAQPVVAIVKFDVRFGRMVRVDRTDSGSGQFVAERVDITDTFEAVFDLENVEVGWLLLGPNRVPDMKLVRRGEMRPERPR
jgi:hypothetical protein